jgi:hypothetical protein
VESGLSFIGDDFDHVAGPHHAARDDARKLAALAVKSFGQSVVDARD